MKRLAIVPMLLLLSVPIVLTVGVFVSRSAWAAPPWGGNCLACHDQTVSGAIQVYNYDFVIDPDESLTGAPDRGPLPTFFAWRGRTRVLRAQVATLQADDTYAVELKRMRFPGVQVGGTLTFGPDCEWPEWGEQASYYTEPFLAYKWGTDPADFAYAIDISFSADDDFYDLVFALGGKFAGTPDLFYDEQHFYLRVVPPLPGDCNCDCRVDFEDIQYFVAALAGEQSWSDYYVDKHGEAPPCPFESCDANGVPPVNFEDVPALVSALGTSCN